MQQNVYSWLVDAAEEFGERAAVCDADGCYSFLEIRIYSMGLGQAVSACLNGGIRRPVAVYMENSKEAVASFMGVVHSGNFYVPIDKEMPLARVHNIFETLDPALILCRDEDLERLQGEFIAIEVLAVDEYFRGGAPVKGDIREPYKEVTNGDLLYVLFTSGSTGIPKGVAIPHKGVINYIDWVTECFSITDADSIGNQAPFYFDNSVLDIYCMLKTGATLHITPHILFSQPVRLLEYIKENRISTIFWVPSALALVARIRALRNVDVSGTLKNILFAGEVLPAKHLNFWRKYVPDAVYANLYGPTEITVDCTCYIVERDFMDDEPIPIGRPIPNVDIIVLDENDCVIGDGGAVGELCVKGMGLAAGYYNNPDKTRESFVQNPVNHSYPERIYRTGDLVKYNEKGELVYITRKDFQVKRMGHRIELGEIEQAALSDENIEACCCVYEDKKKKIVLFVEGSVDKKSVLEQMKEKLPKYMMPDDLVCVEEFPLTANGKVDRVTLGRMLSQQD